MGMYLENIRFSNLETVSRHLKEYQQYDNPVFVSKIYKYTDNWNKAYDRLSLEIRDEYKEGILDPARAVGRAERKRGAVRKQIAAMKRKYARMTKL